MAIDMFMKVEGVNGESKDSNHKTGPTSKVLTGVPSNLVR